MDALHRPQLPEGAEMVIATDDGTYAVAVPPGPRRARVPDCYAPVAVLGPRLRGYAVGRGDPGPGFAHPDDDDAADPTPSGPMPGRPVLDDPLDDTPDVEDDDGPGFVPPADAPAGPARRYPTPDDPADPFNASDDDDPEAAARAAAPAVNRPIAAWLDGPATPAARSRPRPRPLSLAAFWRWKAGLYGEMAARLGPNWGGLYLATAALLAEQARELDEGGGL